MSCATRGGNDGHRTEKFRCFREGKTRPRNQAAGAQRSRKPRVYAAMGYIIALVLLVVFVPLLFMLLSRRTTSGGGIDHHDRGLTSSQPSSDQPTPPAGPRTDRPHAGSDHGVPPG